jgi:hypothetical protein
MKGKKHGWATKWIVPLNTLFEPEPGSSSAAGVNAVCETVLVPSGRLHVISQLAVQYPMALCNPLLKFSPWLSTDTWLIYSFKLQVALIYPLHSDIEKKKTYTSSSSSSTEERRIDVAPVASTMILLRWDFQAAYALRWRSVVMNHPMKTDDGLAWRQLAAAIVVMVSVRRGTWSMEYYLPFLYRGYSMSS